MLARETGWSERFLLWELPLERLLQYQHCALRAHDVWTVSRTAAVSGEEEMAALDAAIEEMHRRDGTDVEEPGGSR
jgi:hypothetical protein